MRRTARVLIAVLGGVVGAALMVWLGAGAASGDDVADADGPCAPRPPYEPNLPSRIAGPDRVATAVAVARAGWPDGAGSVVIAGAGAAPDALAAGPLAACLDAPLLLVPRDTLAEPVRSTLVDLAPHRVHVLGGTTAVSDEVVEAIADLGIAVERHAGPERTATAAAVARTIGSADGVLIAGADRIVDALAAGALLTDDPQPLLLVGERLGADAADAMEVLGATRATVLGGTVAVGDHVVADLEAAGLHVTRLAGPDRWATAAAVLDVAVTGRDRAPLVIASGEAWPDALAAGPLAARRGGSVVITPSWHLPDGTDVVLRELGGRLVDPVALGGVSALEDHVPEAVAAAISGADRPDPPYEVDISPLDAATREAMTPDAWRPGCPVHLDDLRLLAPRHRTFDGSVAIGHMVVHADVAADVAGALGELYDAGFPIARMRPIEEFGGSDDASMEANNTVAFHCRAVTGGTRWSEHASGWAVDLNPVQNPYRRGDVVMPEAGRGFLDRDDVRPGMLTRPGPVEAFDRIGWGWGGDWDSLDDWMHVSLTGR